MSIFVFVTIPPFLLVFLFFFQDEFSSLSFLLDWRLFWVQLFFGYFVLIVIFPLLKVSLVSDTQYLHLCLMLLVFFFNLLFATTKSRLMNQLVRCDVHSYLLFHISFYVMCYVMAFHLFHRYWFVCWLIFP